MHVNIKCTARKNLVLYCLLKRNSKSKYKTNEMHIWWLVMWKKSQWFKI